MSCTFHIFKLFFFLFSSKTVIKTCYEKTHQLNNSVTRCNINAGPAISAAAEKVWRDGRTEIRIDCGMRYFWEHFYGMLCTLIMEICPFYGCINPNNSTEMQHVCLLLHRHIVLWPDRFIAAEKKVLYWDFTVSSSTAQNKTFLSPSFLNSPCFYNQTAHTDPACA